MAEAKKIIIISQKYPFGNGENYMERELHFFAQSYDEVVLLPLHPTGVSRDLNPNIQLSTFFKNKSTTVNKSILFKNLGFILSILWLEFRKTKVKGYFLKQLKKIAAQLVSVIEDMERFKREILIEENRSANFYSVWMDESALMLAMLKKKGLISDFVFRLHGYDLYDERREGHYMPFRYFCFQQAKSIFIVSKAGKDYLQAKNLFSSKLITNYSGLYDQGLNPKVDKNEELVICSCSNLIPLKRVHKIAEVIATLPFRVKWIHLGDGSEKDRIKVITDQFPSHIYVDFRGQVSHAEVMKCYTTEPIDVFVHVSETEGLPLSLVEAMSAGIPIIATDAGGTNEIVNDENGVLLAVDFAAADLKNSITKFQSDVHYWLDKKEGARHQFEMFFNAEVNYPEFIKKIRS